MKVITTILLILTTQILISAEIIPNPEIRTLIDAKNEDLLSQVRTRLGIEKGGLKYSSYSAPPSFKPGTNDLDDDSALKHKARFIASEEMLFRSDLSELDDTGASALYEVVTEGMFRLKDRDGSLTFGKYASKDPHHNLELLRKFLKGERSSFMTNTPLFKYITYCESLSDKGAIFLSKLLSDETNIQEEIEQLDQNERTIIRNAYREIQSYIPPKEEKNIEKQSNPKNNIHWICYSIFSIPLLIIAIFVFLCIIYFERKQLAKRFFVTPIRYLRTLFRRIEKATRPPENS